MRAVEIPSARSLAFCWEFGIEENCKERWRRSTHSSVDGADIVVVDDDVVEVAVGGVRADQVVDLRRGECLALAVVEQDGVTVAVEELVVEDGVEVNDIELRCHCWPEEE
jgi:hypothetical protein